MFPLGVWNRYNFVGFPFTTAENTSFGVILDCFSGEYVETVDLNTEIVLAGLH